MSDLVIKPVLNETDLEWCLKIRNDVFSIERNVPKEIEVDKFDCINGQCEHFLIQYRGEDIGTIRCMNISKTVIKVQRFCFYDKFRKNGFGKETMAYIEGYYRDKGKHKVELEAKFEVCDFYEKCGYEKVSDVFMEVGIKHIKMEKCL